MQVNITFDINTYNTITGQSEKLLTVKCYENDTCTYDLYKPDGSLLLYTHDYDKLFHELAEIEKMAPAGFKICYQVTNVDLECYSDVVKMFIDNGFSPDISTELADESISTYLSNADVPEIDNIIDNFLNFYMFYKDIAYLSHDQTYLYSFIEYDLIDHYLENKELYM